MASLLPSWLWRKREPDNVWLLLLGLDHAGKTTLVGQLLRGERLTTIPTVGMQFDSGPVLSGAVNLNIWEVAQGCSRVPPRLLRHFSGPEVVCLFLINKADIERADEAIDELKYALSRIEAKYFAVVFNNFEGDSAETGTQRLVQKTFDAVKEFKVSNPDKSIQCAVYDDLDQFNTATGAQTDVLLQRILRIARENSEHLQKPPTDKPALTDINTPPSTEALRRKIREGADDPVHQLSSDDFMKQCVTGTLSKWDHRCHLRAGFLTLLESILEEHVVFEASALFLQRLDAMLEANPDKFRNTSHQTLTIFWLHQIYRCMLLFRERTGSLPNDGQFNELLDEHPELMHGRAWDEYWSKDLLFSPAAKEHWVLPDLKPLPQFLTQMKSPQAEDPSSTLAKTNTQIYQQFAYSILQAAESTKRRRAALINDTLPMIQSYIMHRRAQSPGSLEPYSETQAYFWIQMLHTAMRSAPALTPAITELSFEKFAVLFPDLLASEDAWKEFYTADSWNSMEARMRTVLPTRKPLPNVIVAPSQAQVDGAIVTDVDGNDSCNRDGQLLDDGCPGPEDLSLRAQWIVVDPDV